MAMNEKPNDCRDGRGGKVVDFKFPKSHRLLKRPEFLRLSEKGKKITNRYFIVLVTPGQGEHTRLGITVTKRVGCAVQRNRLKRITREFFRHYRHGLKRPWDLNVIAKKSAADLPSNEIFTAIQDIFDRIEDSFDA
jgi:ribonuclease P protein component